MSYFTDIRPQFPRGTNSWASSPGLCSSGSDSDDIDTPLTERSLLFEDEDLEIAATNPEIDEYILVVGGLGYIGM